LTVLDVVGLLEFIFIFLVMIGEMLLSFKRIEIVESGWIAGIAWVILQIFVAIRFLLGRRYEKKKLHLHGMELLKFQSDTSYKKVYRINIEKKTTKKKNRLHLL